MCFSKNQTCSHDVTIALFSRVFYEAKSIDEFPTALAACVHNSLRQDHKGRFFEDFYRVVYQNERYEDWMFSLVKLKHLIKDYRDYILHYHERHTCTQSVPKCYLSNAAEGNFLETLNLSSSVFERNFIDRPFDRTGMMSVVITGGCGVFEVNRELSKITKGRVIDNGIGSDLVCLGEQPLHQVPLFKYASSDTYSVPYWINQSFYKSSQFEFRYCNSKFRPRVKIRFKSECDTRLDPSSILPDYQPLVDNVLLEHTDDILTNPQYEDQHHQQQQQHKSIFMRTISKQQSQVKTNDDQDDDLLIELESDPETMSTSQITFGKNMYHKKVNPFSPSTMNPRMSFDRRRWAHLFPLKPDGTPIFQHWKKVKSTDSDNIPFGNGGNFNHSSDGGFFEKSSIDDFSTSYENGKINGNSSLQNPIVADNKFLNNRKNSTDLDSDECIATMIAGVAWKSLTIPACLPLTTDYMPNEDKCQANFVRVKSYTLVLEQIREEHHFIGGNNTGIKMTNILPELVGHRIALGFQLVQLKPVSNYSQRYKLCCSHTYHELLFLVDKETEYVQVDIWVAKKELEREFKDYEYKYRFQVPDSKLYNVSYCEFSRKKSKRIEWESIDRYICVQGNGSISPLELQNCWRQRLYVLPLMSVQTSNQQNLATIILTHAINSSSKPFTTRFDIYQRKSNDELKVYRESNFIRFMEFLNKVTHADDRRITSNSSKQQNILPSCKEKLDQLLGQYCQDKRNEKSNRAEITAYLKKTYQEAMLSGIPMLTSKDDIPPKCFISAEATWWCIQNVDGIETEAQSIRFMQILLDFDIIKHISKFEKTYIHGFYLYYILTQENCGIKFEYTKDYCEVGLCEFDRGLILDNKSIFNILPKKQELLPVSGTEYSFCQYGLNSTLESPILKIVNVDVDSQKKSTRIEWASALYRSCYHPLCAFEIEIYWKMATGQLLAELINNWTKKAFKFNYHLVPGPVDPFATPFETRSDPLRGYIYIPLNIKALIQDEKILFNNFIEDFYFNNDDQNLLRFKCEEMLLEDADFMEYLNFRYKDNVLELKLQYKQQLIEEEFQEFLEYKRIFYMQYFQEAILERFGFVRNAAITKQYNCDDDTTFFIHSSGGMFVMVPNYYGNLTGRSRHPSAALKQQQKQPKFDLMEVDKYHDSLRSNDDFKEEDGLVEIKNSRVNNNSLSLNITGNKVKPKTTLKRAHSTSRLQLKFYELNKGNISSPKLNEKVFVVPQAVSTKSIDFQNGLKLNKDQFNGKCSDRSLIIIEENVLIEKKKPFYMNKNLFVGFLWSWNFMLGKRWRSQYTGDEVFQDNALADFRAFCSNKDNRLTCFYNDLKPRI